MGIKKNRGEVEAFGEGGAFKGMREYGQRRAQKNKMVLNSSAPISNAHFCLQPLNANLSATNFVSLVSSGPRSTSTTPPSSRSHFFP